MAVTGFLRETRVASVPAAVADMTCTELRPAAQK